MVSTITSKSLKVIIVGCGIGGLVTAIMLDHAGIDYIILEKRIAHGFMGSAIALSPVVLRVLEQIGVYEDLHRLSKEFSRTNVTMADGKKIGVIEGDFSKSRYGITDDPYCFLHACFLHFVDYFGSLSYSNVSHRLRHILARPDLMKVLLSRVAPHKIKMGKKVLRVIEHADHVGDRPRSIHSGSVSVYCSDDSEYKADLVIGCDGAYSTVRQRLYQNMQAEGITVPEADFAPFRFDQHCLVGVTRPLDPELYPALKEPLCEFEVILAKDYSYSVWLMPLKNNCISWMINAKAFSGQRQYHGRSQHQQQYQQQRSGSGSIFQRGKGSHENPPEENFIFPEWGPEDAAEELCNKVRGFRSPYHNGTVEDLLSQTPKDVISKVMLEDKMFETWHSNRVVLLGDACHKVVPFGGQGATQAILDAVALVEILHTLPSTAAKDISQALQLYREKRYPIAQAAITASRQGGAIFSSKGVFMDVLRACTFRFMPRWLYQMTADRAQASRPILSFLPAVPDRGSVRAGRS
ncbi:hypothetical protein BX616_010124 [Lobosporangium transversale]|nr:hypothetical protein BX616_010124 [Lobosporangium transversale]